MSENTRDTQFLGIAELLQKDLAALNARAWNSLDEYIEAKKLLIAQRVHDIVQLATDYTLEYLRECGREVPIDMDMRILPTIPDLTTWTSHGYQAPRLLSGGPYDMKLREVPPEEAKQNRQSFEAHKDEWQ